METETQRGETTCSGPMAGMRDSQDWNPGFRAQVHMFAPKGRQHRTPGCPHRNTAEGRTRAAQTRAHDFTSLSFRVLTCEVGVTTRTSSLLAQKVTTVAATIGGLQSREPLSPSGYPTPLQPPPPLPSPARSQLPGPDVTIHREIRALPEVCGPSDPDADGGHSGSAGQEGRTRWER